MVAVESVKTAADVYAMVDGEIVAVNEALEDEAGLVNHSSEKDGWMIEMKVHNKDQLDNLLTREQYEELL